MAEHKEIKTNEISNVFELLGKQWFLITAGTPEDCNMMTAAWGGLGVMWHKDVCTIYIRPNRYTKKLIESSEYFTISFFDESHRKMLNYCGTVSGKGVDKVAETGLTVAETANGAIYFEEAQMVLECKKIYFQELDPDNFMDPSINKQYPSKDYHTMFIGEITTCLKK